MIRKAKPLLRMYDEQVIRQATQSLTLFGWSLFEPLHAPPIEYIKKRNSRESLILDSERQVPETEAAWNALLDAYNFTKMDEPDLILLQGMRDGYFDSCALTNAANALDKKVMASKQDDSFQAAWRLFHDSLDDNESQFLDALTTTFRKNAENISS